MRDIKKKISKFNCYIQKRNEIKVLKDHYDNHFNLKIEGKEAFVENKQIKSTANQEAKNKNKIG